MIKLVLLAGSTRGRDPHRSAENHLQRVS